MVGNLYAAGDPRRDSGFSIFYVGINIGSFVAFVASAWVREHFGWFWTFRMAGCGLLTGVTLLLLFWRTLAVADRPPQQRPEDVSIARICGVILLPAVLVGLLGYWVTTKWFPGSPVTPQMSGFLAGMVPVIVFFATIGKRAAPAERPGLLALLPIYVAGGTFFMILHLNTTALTKWAEADTDRHHWNVFNLLGTKQDAMPSYFRNAGPEVPRPHGDTLVVVDPVTARQFGTSRLDAAAVAALQRADLGVRVVVTAGALDGIAVVDDPALDRRAANVYPAGSVSVKESLDAHGVPTVAVEVPQGTGRVARVAFTRTIHGVAVPVLLVDQTVHDDVYRNAAADTPVLPPGEFLRVTSPEVFQAANAVCVIVLTTPLILFWALLRRRGREVGTAHKIFYGLLLTMASMLVMALAGWLTQHGTLKVSAWWLIAAYAVVTVGELCLSPMGLSLVTKLSPKRFVGLMMGGWFCATAFGNKLSGFFGGVQSGMEPMRFFLVLAACVALVAVGIRLLLPWLDRTLRSYKA